MSRRSVNLILIMMFSRRLEGTSPEPAPPGAKYGVVVVVALLFYVHGKHLRSCLDGQLT